MLKLNKINNIIDKEYNQAVEHRCDPELVKQKSFELLILTIRLLIAEFVFWIFNLFRRKSPENISKQLALVTGGGNGLGRAFCFRLAQENCDIAVVDIDLQGAERTSKEIKEKFGVKSYAYKCDISDYSAILELKEKIDKEMGTVDILVNNAALLYLSTFESNEVADIQRVVNVNLTGYIMMIHTFLRSMIQQKRGKIVSVSSVVVESTFPLAVVYGSTKFGIHGLMDCLYDELSQMNLEDFIKLTTVYPDAINTRKEHAEALTEVNYIFTRMTPERVADESVNAMLMGERKVLVSDAKNLISLMRLFPKRVQKALKRATFDIKPFMK